MIQFGFLVEVCTDTDTDEGQAHTSQKFPVCLKQLLFFVIEQL